MKTFRKLALVVSVMVNLSAAGVAQAHGIYFAQRSTHLALIYGVGSDDLDMLKRLPKVKTVAGYLENGQETPTQLVPNGPLVVVNTDKQTAIVTATIDYGPWSKAPDGEWYGKVKSQVPNVTASMHTYKYTVHMRRLNVVPTVLSAHKLQIIPLVKQLPDQMGKELTVQVLYEGKPVQGASVQADFVNDPDNVQMKTGADGTATIKVRNQGLNVLAATYSTPSMNSMETDEDEHLATLSFILPHLPE